MASVAFTECQTSPIDGDVTIARVNVSSYQRL